MLCRYILRILFFIWHLIHSFDSSSSDHKLRRLHLFFTFTRAINSKPTISTSDSFLACNHILSSVSSDLPFWLTAISLPALDSGFLYLFRSLSEG